MAKRLHGSRRHLVWSTEVVLGPDDIVLDGDRAPPPKKGSELPPQFSAHVYCGEMAGWTEMALGMEVGGQKGAEPLNF